MTIRTLIVDDEPHASEIIKKYALNIPEIEIVGTANNAVNAFQILQNTQVDLIFLDIKMPGLTGIDFIRNLKTPPMIIFTTAYQEYAMEGFDLDAIDYLLKPIPLGRFLRAMEKVIQFINGNKNRWASKETESPSTPPIIHYMYLRIERQLFKVNTKDILWIESIKDYIKVITKDKTFQTKQKISVAEKMLPISEFMRIHRSFIIQIDKIDSYHPNYIVVDGNKIPIGRNYKLLCSQKFSPDKAFN